MARLKKMYIRNSSGVFVAVPGFEYSEVMVFVDLSVYTSTRSILPESYITLQKK